MKIGNRVCGEKEHGTVPGNTFHGFHFGGMEKD